MTKQITQTARITAWLLTALMLLSGILCIHIDAADSASTETDPIYVSNNALLMEKYTALNGIKIQNVGSEIGRSVNSYVEIYEQKMNKLEDSKLYEESTAGLIELYYMQGLAANKVAWIYYSYIGQFEGEAKDAIDRVHNGVHTSAQEIDGLQDEIAYAANASDIEERLSLSYNNNGLCARMYVAIYRQKLLALPEDSDSDAVKAIVSGEGGALEAIAECTDVTTNTQYEQIYLEAKAAVEIQRNKDIASRQLQDTFALLYPNSDPAENEILQNALAKINSADMSDPAKMNEILMQTVSAWLPETDENTGAYVTEYYSNLNLELTDRIASANDGQQIADISSVFTNFTLDLARAEAKDNIVADIQAKEYADSKEMQNLLNAYTVSTDETLSIIDECKSLAEISFEIDRAALLTDLYGEYLKTTEIIQSFVSDSALLTEAYDQYDYTKIKIENVDRLSEGALDSCTGEFEKGSLAFEELTVEAEVLAYETKYASVLQKDVTEITEADKESLLAAIEEMKGLTEGAKAVFTEKHSADDLANKYKAIVEAEIKSHVGTDTGIRKELFYDLKEQLQNLHISGDIAKLEELTTNANLLTEKAIAADLLLDQYEEMQASEDYAGFSNENKTAIDNLVKNSVSEICNSDGNAEDFQALADLGATNLEKTEACAKIDAYVDRQTEMNADTKAAVEALAEQAKQKINEETDTAEIDSLVSDAMFDIKQELDIQKLTEEAEAAIESVSGLHMLTDEQKQEYVKKIEDCLKDQIANVRNASDEETHNTVLKAFDDMLSEIMETAVTADETQKKDAQDKASKELNEAYQQVVQKIDSMTYLSEEEKEVLRQEAELALTKGLETVDSASTSAEVENVKLAILQTLNQISQKSADQDAGAKTAKTTEYNNEIKTKAAEILAEIDQTLYLTEDKKAELKQQVEDAVIELTSQLSSSETRADLTEAVTTASNKLTEISRSCSEQELSIAKQTAVEEIENAEASLASLIASSKFMSDSNKNSLQQKGTDTAVQGKESVEACLTVDEVHSERDYVLKEFAKQKSEATLAEDEACVETLTPFMTGFAIACGVEAVALAALWIAYRKKTAMACFIPVFALALMPTPLAWTLTVVLGVADIAMAVLIGYLAVKLWKLKKNEPVIFPEPDTDYEEDEILEEEDGENMPIPTTATAPEPKRFGLKGKSKLLGLFAPAPRLKLTPKPQLIYLMPPSIPQLLPSVSVDEANRMISDEDAFHCEETNILNTEVYTGRRKASINIDTISAHFAEGETVTLNTLKEKKLISEKVGHIKILGRGRLDKPLTVIAQNFSASAVKMIVLTGGQAILAEGSPERRRR